MHKLHINELELALTIQPLGPIMVKEQSKEAAGGGTSNEMKFVRTAHPTTRKHSVYLPGSSLKGVLRSHSEKITRTLGAECCNPFLIKDEDLQKPDCFCGKKIEQEKEHNENLTVPQMYKSYSCRVCKLFGSTGIGSRFFIEDAFPTDNQGYEETRTNVAIDRKDGSAVAPFSMDVITTHPFHTTLYLRNFELWQLGLLGLTLRDLHQERVRIGFAKSRGLGKVKATVSEAKFTYHGFKLSNDKKSIVSLNGKNTAFNLLDGSNLKVYGVGKLMETAGTAYGFSSDDEVAVELEESQSAEDDWISVNVTLTDFEKQIIPLLRECVDKRWLPVAQSDATIHDESGGK